MADFILINEHSNKGALGISRKIIETIVDEAVTRVVGENDSNSKSVKISTPTKIYFKKDGKVEINVSIVISKKGSPEKICMMIQEEIAHDLATYTESLPFEILISISDVK